MRVPFVPRERDEEILLWIDLRRAGMSARRIAKLRGTSPGAVIVATQNVRDADRAESGEQVEGYYW